jgi:glyoxylase-like metal-dependent hydrolase (beta-lactamase superfamily II)
VCYHVGNVLFSGDVLFYRTVGRTDLEGMSWESLVVSVRRLYSLLPDETIVYPGHMQFTTIGSEKMENAKIPEDKSNKP